MDSPLARRCRDEIPHRVAQRDAVERDLAREAIVACEPGQRIGAGQLRTGAGLSPISSAEGLMSEESKIEFTGKLAETVRNLTGDEEFRVIFVLDPAAVPAAAGLFHPCWKKRLLTVTVRHDHYLPTAIRFRCIIPDGKTHLGGRKAFRVRPSRDALPRTWVRSCGRGCGSGRAPR